MQSPTRGISVRGKKKFLVSNVGVEQSETPQHTLAVSYAVFWLIEKESVRTHKDLRRTAIS